VTFEEGLVKRLLDDVGTHNGSLPLLQFVLEKLWDKQEPGLLTHQGYVEICGGSKNINLFLANYAEKIFAHILSQEKDQTIFYLENPSKTWTNWLLTRTIRQNEIYPKGHRLKQVLLCLVTIGENSKVTRRIATRSEIGENNWRDIVAVLADQRLVVTNRQEQTQEETVKIIHEATIHYCPTLQHWINEYRNKLTQLREIEAATETWHNSRKSKHLLWQGKQAFKYFFWSIIAIIIVMSGGNPALPLLIAIFTLFTLVFS
jgi:metal-sulfur cluster biosynthetic enzyme